MRPQLLVRLASSIALPLGPVLAQESSAPFDAPTVVLAADSAPFQRLLDHDGDGDLDAVGAKIKANASEYTCYVWRNDGQGALNEVYQHAGTPLAATGSRPVPVATGDFDGDGDDDFALGLGALCGVYTSDGSGGFAAAMLAAPYPIAAIGAADLDGDGAADLILAMDDRFQVHVRIVWADGSTNDAAVPGLRSPNVTILDTDGDALPDFMLWQRLWVVPFTVEARALQVGLPIQGAVGSLFAAGDADGDGDDDIVGFDTSVSINRQHEVLRRVSPSAWQLEAPKVGGPAEFLADVDGDGDLDGVCCGGGGGGGLPNTYPTLNQPSTFEVAINDGSGTFAPSFSFSGLGSTQLAGAADLDADGDVDLVAGRCVYWGRGPLSKSPMPQTRASLAVLRSYLIGDGDGDGDLELGVSVSGGYYNQGDGTFAVRYGTAPKPPAGQMWGGPGYYGDFDGDGSTDQIVPLWQPNPPNPPTLVQVMLWANNGSGGAFVVPAAPAGMPMVIGQYNYTVDGGYVADLDGDDDLDVVSRLVAGPPQSALFWNDGTGYFSAGPVLNERVEAAGDLDGDGRNDLLVGSGPGGFTYGVCRGLGAGSFAPVQLVLPSYVGDWVNHPPELRDYNDDGELDVAFIDANDVPHVLFNQSRANGGQLAFVESLVLGGLVATQTRASITGLDANADGLTDLVVGAFQNEPNGSLLLLRKPGTSGNLSLLDYTAVMQISAERFVADLDGDGTEDLVGAELVRNASFAQSQRGERLQQGSGTPGEGGFTPILGAVGPFRAGVTMSLRLRGCAAGTAAAILLSTAGGPFVNLPFPGITAWVDPTVPGFVALPVGIPGTPNGRAQGRATLSLPLLPSFAGATAYLQAFVLDPSAAWSLASTNGLRISVGS